MKETLKDLRLQSGKTCAEVAQALNATVRTVNRYEQGTRRISLEQVLILAELYNCTVREVVQSQLNSTRSDR